MPKYVPIPPTDPRSRLGSLFDRWLRRVVVVPIECWRWIGSKHRAGYGSFHGYAHRFAYEHFVGPIPKGLVIDHMCLNKWCVNPSHLRVVTTKVNSLASGNSPPRLNSLKTECPKCSSEFDAHKNGWRFCRTCANASWRRLYAKKRSDPEWIERYRKAKREWARKDRLKKEKTS
jgi:hypothetical protein